MEDYAAAYHERFVDTIALDEAERHLAAIHWGGVATECLLKSLVVAGRGISEWETEQNPTGHGVTNPGHALVAAIKRHNKLWNRFQQFPEAMRWLDKVDTPSVHFIDIRYRSDPPSQEAYREWKHAFVRLTSWLHKQSTQI
jgi:hypothetical protein